MIGSMQITSCSMRVFPATRAMLAAYPTKELRDYAKSIGVKVGRSKSETIDNLIASGRATVCASLGN